MDKAAPDKKSAYFITLCTKNRMELFWERIGAGPIRRPSDFLNNYRLSDIGNMVNAAILAIPEKHDGVRVEKYVVMPNHVHILAVFEPGADGRSATPAAVANGVRSAVTDRTGISIWDRAVSNQAVNSEKEYRETWAYIDTNPQQWEHDCYYAP